MVCTNCQNVNEARALYCNQCATQLTEEPPQGKIFETSFIIFWVATAIMLIGLGIMVSWDLPLKWR
jgi:hypothetical protein